MSYEFPPFVPKGWQCPVCRRVYSPDTPMCYYCGNEEIVTTTTFTITPETVNKTRGGTNVNTNDRT